MNQPLFLKPIFQERIWGGTALRDQFDYNIPSDHTGECWAISAHPNGPSVVEDGPFSGKTVAELWEERRDLFGGMKGEVFPLLTKILDASTDLSVQVHPNDEYARINENGELGKTECWYIIDCKQGAEMIYGHTAQSKKEFADKVEKGEWTSLLRRVPIQPGDFFFVPSGTVHALCEGTLVLETQQSSDTTYRVYDYDRIDAEGNKRELHIEKSIDVSTIPHVDAPVESISREMNGVRITHFVDSSFFSVEKWEVSGTADFQQNKPFMLFSVIDGEGVLKKEGKHSPIKRGAHFILPNGFDEFSLEGQLTLIASWKE
ncbi:mannose-6-phosphate isomerase, class I [Domibacillus enclensis]|uniref:Mannose-6-phosphate isomerase n=1 Tax=Domibacillus enclensis TaxID=1017273 RepID=A0A1N6RRT4_9BACI|nr:mannose-6-phosphate isomerase, class I [Domibacillus enclensis]OXS79127.1 mannose-6-phosphate isomerase, class I [Domibacillus enclensis]SIQ31580.1 mannose-6-phosphate isomerase, type 1 [Domibacillus enclensis]